mmetsp:Transcript_30494/g.59906  ORF Transcript_30494/g.59906 Transcript_30494/m.59906 type:complete len:93 (+) Transcript_30494:537-815(+)
MDRKGKWKGMQPGCFYQASTLCVLAGLRAVGIRLRCASNAGVQARNICWPSLRVKDCDRVKSTAVPRRDAGPTPLHFGFLSRLSESAFELQV